MNIRRQILAAGGWLAAALTLASVPALATAATGSCPNEAFRVGASLSLPECRAYELVSPHDKNSFNVEAAEEGAPELPGQATPSGGGVSFLSTGAFAGAPASWLKTTYISSRTESGWSTQSPDLPAVNNGQLLFQSFAGADEELDLSVEGSLLALAPGAVQGNMNLYLRDNATGALTLIATSSDFSFVNRVDQGYGIVSAATPDYSHIVLVTTAALTPDATAGVENNIYDWDRAEAKLRLVSRVGTETVETAGGSLSTPTRGSDPISDDGSRIFFTSTSDGAIYMREDDQRTVPISVSRRAGDPSTAQAATFVSATAGGSLVYFTTEAKLTENAGSGPGLSLYRYDVASRQLSDLTPAGEERDVGKVLSVSADGSYVYFEAGGIPYFGEPDRIYVWHDGTSEAIEEKILDEETFYYNASPNGRYLAFGISTPLTSYDNQSAACFGRCEESYVYDASTGVMSCMSCDSGGEPPHGASTIGAAFAQYTGEHLARTVLDDGSVFFESPEALVPQDDNGQIDVYRWRNGQLDLISTGQGETESSFLDASEDGSNIFIYTEQRLVGADTDDSIDVYDARVDGGFPEPTPAASCSGTGCQGVPSAPPPFATPASETFNGVGNFAAPVKSTSKSKAKKKKPKAKKKKSKAKKKAKAKSKSKRGKARAGKTRTKHTSTKRKPKASKSDRRGI
jgi:hypothetical protein